MEQRGERARVASWSADGKVAHLSPTAMRPLSADFVGSCLERLRARGFTSVVTSALSEAECAGFLRAGFDVQEELELLAHELNAIPEVHHRLRRPPERPAPGPGRRRRGVRIVLAPPPGGARGRARRDPLGALPGP